MPTSGTNGDPQDPTATVALHSQQGAVAAYEIYPPHPPRTETSEYAAAHKRLTLEEDRPCHRCGVRHSTLGDPAQNPHQASALETHHWPVERAFIDACDPVKLHVDFPQVTDVPSMLAWVDSEANLLVLCDKCHRDPHIGIHHALAEVWFAGRYFVAGWVPDALTAAEARLAVAADAHVQLQAVVEVEDNYTQRTVDQRAPDTATIKCGCSRWHTVHAKIRAVAPSPAAPAAEDPAATHPGLPVPHILVPPLPPIGKARRSKPGTGQTS